MSRAPLSGALLTRNYVQMRLFAAALAGAAFLALWGTAAYAADTTPFDHAGFHLVLPAGYTEQPNLEQTAVDGFHKGDPGDTVQAFAWSSAARNVFFLVQVTTSSQAVPAGTFRTNLEAMNKAIPPAMGLASVAPALSDDGTVMTGTFEGASDKVDTLAMTQGMVDKDRHVHAYSLMCMMVEPPAPSAQADCHALLGSFQLTLDKSTLLPLEAK